MTSAIRPVLGLRSQTGQRAGEDRFALLAEIDRTGSIASAARKMGMSYRGAWDAVNALNNLFPVPLVISQPGGKSGGGASLTVQGRRVLSAHRKLTALFGEIIDNLESDEDDQPLPLQSLLWNPMMKTSARNTYYGTISDVRRGAVNAEVSLKISPDVTLTAIITEQSVLNLDIAPGKQAYALIKASAPILIPTDEKVLTSARNRIEGTVASIEKGAVNSEVVLDIGGNKTLCAIVTDDSADALKIVPGASMTALIKASQIILALTG